VAAVENTGQFDDNTDELVSAVLEWHGAAYGGIATVSVPTATEYLPPQSNTAKFLRVEDAGHNKMTVPHTIEEFGLDEVLVVQGYHYSGSTGLRMLPADQPILLNGQMSNYPLIGGANCHSPADETDPAWLQVCLRSFVKHSLIVINECSQYLPYVKDFADENVNCWYGGHLAYPPPTGTFNRYVMDPGEPKVLGRNHLYSHDELNSLTVTVSSADFFGYGPETTKECSIFVYDGTGDAFELGHHTEDITSEGTTGSVNYSFTIDFVRPQPANHRMDVAFVGGGNSLALRIISFG